MPDTRNGKHEKEVAEVLESETHVDMEKMLALAQRGVPDRLRAEAWKYMLGVSRAERAEEMSLRKRMDYEHKEVEKAWRSRPNGELSRAVKAEVMPHRAALGRRLRDVRRQGHRHGVPAGRPHVPDDLDRLDRPRFLKRGEAVCDEEDAFHVRYRSLQIARTISDQAWR